MTNDPYQDFTSQAGDVITRALEGKSYLGFFSSETHVLPRRRWSQMDANARQDFLDHVLDAFQPGRFDQFQDPRGWIGQGMLHSWICSGESPLGDIHQNWLFLPWHRAFLYFHEKLIRHLTKDDSFRLPVWDWESEDGKGSVFPREHALARAPLNTNLFQFADFSGCNYLGKADFSCVGPPGKFDCPVTLAQVTAWLQSPDFLGTDSCPGACVGGPHYRAHYEDNAFFFNFSTAALHPILYAHHVNVDRCWEQWLTLNGHSTPKEWDETHFTFFSSGDGAPISLSATAVVHSEHLGYSYDSLPVPNTVWAVPIELGLDPVACIFDFAGDRAITLRRKLRKIAESPVQPDVALAQHPVLQLCCNVPHPEKSGQYIVTLVVLDGANNEVDRVEVGPVANISMRDMHHKRHMSGEMACADQPDACGIALNLNNLGRLRLVDAGPQLRYKAVYQKAVRGKGEGRERLLNLTSVRILYSQAIEDFSL